MKLFPIPHKTFSLSKSMLAASIAYLGLAQQSDAGVTWLASDDGTDLTLTTSGTLNTTTAYDLTTSTGAASGIYLEASNAIYGVGTSYLFDGVNGSVTHQDPWILPTTIASSVSGHTFGYSNSAFYWDPVFGNNPISVTPVTTITFSGVTVATAFGTNLDFGDVVLWSHHSGDTISVGLASVPEPSSTALLGLGGLVLMLRRKR